MALTSTEKREIEVMIRKEVKDFLGSNTLRQFEEKMIDLVVKEMKRGKVGNETKEIVAKMFSEFYQFMWTQKSYWEPRIKNIR
jgi:hypothetical protein